MRTLYGIGLDIHKKMIVYCIKTNIKTMDGCLVEAATIAATRKALDEWLKRLPGPGIAAMEATIFTG
ncbi:MAG: hypothetical protein ABR512_15250 [Desulfopila sp.]